MLQCDEHLPYFLSEHGCLQRKCHIDFLDEVSPFDILLWVSIHQHKHFLVNFSIFCVMLLNCFVYMEILHAPIYKPNLAKNVSDWTAIPFHKCLPNSTKYKIVSKQSLINCFLGLIHWKLLESHLLEGMKMQAKEAFLNQGLLHCCIAFPILSPGFSFLSLFYSLILAKGISASGIQYQGF